MLDDHGGVIISISMFEFEFDSAGFAGGKVDAGTPPPTLETVAGVIT